ncbi:hypothetical protein ACMHYB_43645 [Sorangium sp. So ce1128]
MVRGRGRCRRQLSIGQPGEEHDAKLARVTQALRRCALVSAEDAVLALAALRDPRTAAA